MDPAGLQRIEAMCEVFYQQPNSPDWANAKQHVELMQSSVEHIPTCQYVLNHSQNSYALLLAATALRSLITKHWNNYDTAQHIQIRDYVLSYLSERGTGLQDFGLKAMVALLCRITKLGWFDDAKHREIVADVGRFLDFSIDHCVLGLRIYRALVEELNLPISGRTITQHRKTAVSFRDNSLLDVFRRGVQVLQHVGAGESVAGATPEQKAALQVQSLELLVACLQYDFIGTNPDESTDDVGTIQVPSCWRTVIQDPATLGLLLQFYQTAEPPASSQAMAAVVLLSSVRRSLFQSDTARGEFLARIMGAIRDVLRGQIGLQHPPNRHEFCRLLGRLKANYQLSELVRTEVYSEWVTLVANFSEHSFQQWQESGHSMQYILQLWVRLVAAVPYVNPEASGTQAQMVQLEQCVVRVVQSYVSSMLQAASACVRDASLDDMLSNEAQVREQVERLPHIFRFQYPTLAEYLVTQCFDPIMGKYQQLTTALDQSAPGMANTDQAMQTELETCEAQLAWLTYIVGAILSGVTWNSGPKEGHERLDGTLSKRCFQLAAMVSHRTEKSGGQAAADERLELAIMFFLGHFRKAYLVETGSALAMTSINAQMGSPGGGVRGLLGDGGGASVNDMSDSSLATSLGPSVGGFDGSSRSTLTSKQRATLSMYDAMEQGDPATVTNAIMLKIFANLRFCADSEELLSETIELFLDLASSASSGKVLLRLQPVQTLLGCHTPQHFSFLGYHSNRRLRTKLHATLARLVFQTSSDELSLRFRQFLEPTLAVLQGLTSLSPQQLASNNEARDAFMGVCRDLRGICQACTNKRTYMMLFEALYPTYFPVFARAAECFYDQPDTMFALFKFMQEFVNNKAQRVNFSMNSPNGILLFRETSSVLVAYGSRAPHAQPRSEDIYREKYKGIALCLRTLKEALNGNYVNFGVFELYGDKALESALDVALSLALSVPVDQVLVYQKLSLWYYKLLDALFQSHLPYIASKDTATFMKLMEVLYEGLSSLEAPQSTDCARCIDHLATYLWQNREKAGTLEAMHQLRGHISSNARLFPDLTAKVFEQLLFGPYGNHWAVTRPILSIMLADEASFASYRAQLMATQTPENQAKLEEAFVVLLSDVQKNLDLTNRDRFAQRLSNFRQKVRDFLTL